MVEIRDFGTVPVLNDLRRAIFQGSEFTTNHAFGKHFLGKVARYVTDSAAESVMYRATFPRKCFPKAWLVVNSAKYEISAKIQNYFRERSSVRPAM